MNKNLYKFFHPDLTHDNIYKALISFALPLMFSQLFQQLYNTTDTVIIGHFLGEKSLAAISSCVAIYELLVGFGVGFGNGLGIVAARAYGACDVQKLKKITASSIVITFAVTLILVVSARFFLKPLLTLLGTPAEILEEAYSYINLVSIFCGVLFAYNLLSGMLRAIGNSFMPLVFLLISSVLNIALDILLITKLGLGIRGTAIATVLAQGTSAIFCLIYILNRTTILIPDGKHFKAEGSLYRDLIGQGLSMALMSALVSSGSVILQSSINGFGTAVLAGHISARKIFGISIIPMIMMGPASATFVSQNLGAGRIDRIKKGVIAADLLCVAWAVLCLATLPFAARFLISAVSGSTSSGVLEYGSKYITFMQPFYAVLGVLFVTRNSLQGLGSKILPLISSIIELFGKVLFTLVIIPHSGTWGIIMCEPLIWVFMTIQLLWVFIRHPAFRNQLIRNA